MQKTREQYFRIFREVSKAITSTLDLREVLNLIVKNAAEALDIKGASLRLLDPKGEKLQISVAYGLSDEYLQKGPQEVEKSLLDRQVEAGKSVTVLDAATDPQFQYAEEAIQEGIRSVLCFPLIVENRMLGVLCAYTSEPRDFAPEEMDFLSALAEQSAIAINNARAHERMQSLYEVGKTINATLDLGAVLRLITENAAKMMDAKGCSIMLLDETREKLEVSAAYGLSQEYLSKGPLEADKSIAEALKGETVMILDAATDPRLQYPEAAKREGIASVLCMPIRVRDNVIGVLRLYTATRRQFTKDEVEFLSALVEQGAIAIENARLHEQVKEDYRKLKQAEAQLIQSEKLASMGQLAAGVAHELNNPLGTILIYSHMLLKELDPSDPRREDFEMIVREANRCRSIATGLLDFARESRLDARGTDVNALVEETISLMSKHSVFSQVSVIKDLDANLPSITADPAQLKQAFLNILTNAGEAMPNGGTLTVSTRLSEDGQSVKVSFADTGVGIPKEKLDQLFTPFFTTKHRGRGTGLGLAIVYGIVKMHRGSIDVKSKVGEGTTFTITLPIEPVFAKPAEQEVLA